MKQIHGIHKKGIIIEVTAKTGNDSGFSLQEWIDNLYEEKKGICLGRVLLPLMRFCLVFKMKTQKIKSPNVYDTI